jgi:aminoglycoside phosphotransferase
MFATDPQAALEWLHSQLGVAGKGDPANRPDLHGDLPRLGVLAGEMLAQVHSLDASNAPLMSGWDHIDSVVAERLEGGLIDPDKLGKPYAMYKPQKLVQLWRQGRPNEEDLVVCCGLATLENLLISDSKFAGLASGEDAIVADRHLDLAVIQQSIHVELGSEAVFAFYEGYGSDASILKLDHYVLASRLLGIVQ